MRRRRPAAAPGPLRRPAAAPGQVRRPALGEQPADLPPPDPVEVGERFHRGEKIRAEECPLSLLKAGEWIRAEKAIYEAAEVDVAGRVRTIEVDGVSWDVVFTPSGTRLESLLKVITALEEPILRGHLCRADCDRKRSNPNLVHFTTLQKISAGSPVTWETNCEVEDNLPQLRAAQAGWEKGQEKGENAKERENSSSSRDKKKKKEKKKEKKKAKKEIKKEARQMP